MAVHLAVWRDYQSVGQGLPLPTQWDMQFNVLMALSLLFSIIAYFPENFGISLSLILVRFLIVLVLGYPLGSYYVPEMYLMAMIILEAVFCLPLKGGIPLSVFLSVVLLINQGPVDAWGVISERVDGQSLLLMGLFFFLFILLSSLVKLRTSRLSQVQTDYQRLDQAISRLTEVNLDYQNHMQQVESEGMEKERRRISREIHDIIGYTLTNQLMIVQAILSMKDRNDPKLEKILTQSRQQIEEGMNDARTTLRRLHFSSPDEPQGMNLILKLIRTFESLSGVKVTVDFTNLPTSLGRRQDKVLYRLVQEGMTNAFRHGMATEVHITLWKEEDTLLVVIEDNGRGAEKIVQGVGISGMKERIAELGGSLELESLGRGFTLRSRIPLNLEELRSSVSVQE